MTSVEFRKDLFADERDDNLLEVGKPTIRQDIKGHVTGQTKFYDDHLFDGLLHMRCVRSPHHHARIRGIDTSAAERMPGVRKIVRPSDVPNNLNTLLSLIGFGRDDEQLLASQKVAYRGEPVCAVIADSERLARDAVAAIRVDWEVLPHVLDVEQALLPDAPVVNEAYPNNTFDYGRFDHQKLRFGDVQKAFAQADHLVEGEYQMSPIEQAPMETAGAIAAPETNDRFVCHTSTQALFFSLGTTAKLLDMSSSRLHFIGGTVGGGFGGKVDSIVEPMSVLGAVLTGKPVKFQWDREEEMQVGAPRGAERWYIKDGVMNDGRIVARELTGFFDSGAYTRLSSYAIQKCTGHLPGPYFIPNVASNVYCVFTNRTPATAMRGFGVTAVDFSMEVHMDKVAHQVGMNPIELRILNAYRDGDMKAHRRKAKNTALIECCQVVAQKAGVTLGSTYASDSSLQKGGTPERAAIPETVSDMEGLIDERKTKQFSTRPAINGTVNIPAGQANETLVAVVPQRDDMQIDAARVGHKTMTPQGIGAPEANGSASIPQTASSVAPTTHAPQDRTTQAPSPMPAPASSSPPSSHTSSAPTSPTPYAPSQPFDKGSNRPGAGRRFSNRGRR